MSMIGEYRRVTPEKLSQLLAGDPQGIDDFLSDSWDFAEEEILRIDKTWQAIHFLLNDDPHTGEGPLYDAVWGGTDTAAESTYGPVRYLTADQVKITSQALDRIVVTEFIAKYNASLPFPPEIYLDWSDSDEDREYLRFHFVNLVAFFRSAAASGDAMFLYIS